MQHVCKRAVQLLDSSEPFALAVVVETIGSTPQKAGAAALIHPDGSITGTLGGGCLEAEARRQALECLRAGTRRLVQLHLDGDFGFDDGLLCGGSAFIFIDGKPYESAEVIRSAARAVETRTPAVLIIAVAPEGPMLGRCWLHTRDSPVPDFATAAEQVLQTADPSLVVADTPHGQLRAYIQPLLPKPVLLIVGAGHIGAALCHFGSALGFDVVVVDDRPSFANAERLPGASKIIVDDIPSAVRSYPIDKNTYVAIVTRGHRHDCAALRECIARPAAYIGMIGSRRKIGVIYKQLMEEGSATEDMLARVYAPIGLDIGAVTVEEIAVSIAAELVMVRRGVSRPSDPRTPVQMKSRLAR
ncbi:MAG: XdhC family protein [Armatimonadota bacterium]